jgi:hypothetical protein
MPAVGVERDALDGRQAAVVAAVQPVLATAAPARPSTTSSSRPVEIDQAGAAAIGGR